MDALGVDSLGQERLESGATWGALHEIGHNFQESRWTPTDTTEVTCNIFATMINNKVIYCLVYHKSKYQNKNTIFD